MSNLPKQGSPPGRWDDIDVHIGGIAAGVVEYPPAVGALQGPGLAESGGVLDANGPDFVARHDLRAGGLNPVHHLVHQTKGEGFAGVGSEGSLPRRRVGATAHVMLSARDLGLKPCCMN